MGRMMSSNSNVWFTDDREHRWRKTRAYHNIEADDPIDPDWHQFYMRRWRAYEAQKPYRRNNKWHAWEMQIWKTYEP
jgi:hypothetical protein